MASRILGRPMAAMFRPIPTQSRRMLTTGRPLLIKENAHRTPEELEGKKQEQLDKQKRGEGHWDEALASQGESNIAADKEKVNNHDEHIGKLQEETKKKGDKGEI
ncbi:hypothetical protein B0J11DRAFT_432846 [Dendryphion nanum]|uniref:Uncharacterized protein n=1 Tax=Dendryphion nanum TaxID=256645 RepID=A0A9P9ILU4_9PLEO|nr:hypothetical protein B0J11DRAFT_432846 [Dendryphion nanum]